MTRVRLPPSPAVGGSVITTIMDSQGGDAALISALSEVPRGAPLSRNQDTDSIGNSPDVGVTQGGSNRVDSDPSAVSGTVGLGTPGYSGSGAKRGFVEKSVNYGDGINHVDSIILVYDLDRIETFTRLESHWLPLIERCYNGEVGSSCMCLFFI